MTGESKEQPALEKKITNFDNRVHPFANLDFATFLGEKIKEVGSFYDPKRKISVSFLLIDKPSNIIDFDKKPQAQKSLNVEITSDRQITSDCTVQIGNKTYKGIKSDRFKKGETYFVVFNTWQEIIEGQEGPNETPLPLTFQQAQTASIGLATREVVPKGQTATGRRWEEK